MNIIILTDSSGGGEQKVNDNIIHTLMKQFPQENFLNYSLKPARTKGWFTGFKNFSLNRQRFYQWLVKQSPQDIDCLLALSSSSRLVFQLTKKLNPSISIVHFFHADINFIYPLYRPLLTLKQITGNFIINLYARFLHIQSLRFADKIMVTSNLCKRVLMRRYGISSAKIHLLPMGVNHNIYKPKRKSLHRVTSWLKLPSQPIIIFSGRIEPEKGLDNLIIALSIIKHRHLFSLIVIHPKISPYRKEFSHRCQRLIRNCGVQLSVRYVESPPEDMIALLYQSATCVVLPSISETGPNVMYEALASGTLFTAPRVGGVPEVLSAIDRNLILRDRKPETIARCLKWVLTILPSVRKALIVKGKQSVSRLSWENTAHHLISVLKR